METITSAGILKRLRERSEAKLEEQRSNIDRFAWDIIRSSEAMVALIYNTGEFHIDLKDRRKIDDIVEGFYNEDQRLWSRLHGCTNLDDLAVAQGNARITRKPGAADESLCIVCTYRFNRDVLAPKFLSDVAEVAKKLSSPMYLRFDLIKVYNENYPEKEFPESKWTLAVETRDDSIIVTLS